MGTVFINYRRGETAGEARALFNDLAAMLGKDSVFMDVDNIALGSDFRQVLHDRLGSCELMLALIGKDWVDAKNPSGQRRLDDPGDYVRLEIEAALKRNIPITPVLVQGAQMPSVKQLPEHIRDFAYRNGFELSHTRWDSDIHEMIKRLGLGKQPTAQGEESLTAARGTAIGVPAAPPSSRKVWFALIVVSVAIAVAGGGALYYRSEQAESIAKAEADKARADAEAAKANAAAEAERARAAAAQADRDRIAAAERDERDRQAAALAANRTAKDQAAQQERDRQAAALAANRAAKDQAAQQISLNGSWRETSKSGTTYVHLIEQRGNNFNATLSASGRGVIGKGQGVISGRNVVIRYAMTDSSVGECTFTLSADGRALNGSCRSSTGKSAQHYLYR